MTDGLSVALAAISLTGCNPTVGAYDPPIAWKASVAVGRPFRGSLRRGVLLPAAGPNHVTYDPARRTIPNRAWRRWGTNRLVRTTMCVIEDYRRANPEAPRVVIGDLSRQNGGTFGPRFGGKGHVSHQNGLDVDVYYPRWDGREAVPRDAGDVKADAAKELADRFAAAGASLIVVGPDTLHRKPAGRLRLEIDRHHDDHMHIRLRRR